MMINNTNNFNVREKRGGGRGGGLSKSLCHYLKKTENEERFISESLDISIIITVIEIGLSI